MRLAGIIALCCSVARAFRLPSSDALGIPESTHVLIYQYGKVASSSLTHSLGRLMHPPRVIDEWELGCKDHWPTALKTHYREIATCFMEQVPNNTDVWVVAVVRNRLQQLISNFFQQIRLYFDNPVDAVQKVLTMPITELHDVFRQNLEAGNISGSEDGWFTANFLPVTGVDLVQHAKQIRQGRRVVRHELGTKHLKVLLLRFEDIMFWETFLLRIFPGFHMTSYKQTGTKWYAEKYKEFVRTYVHSEKELLKRCNGETMAFYSEEEKCKISPACCPGKSAHRPLDIEEDPARPGHGYVRTSSGQQLLVYDTSVGGFDDEDAPEQE